MDGLEHVVGVAERVLGARPLREPDGLLEIRDRLAQPAGLEARGAMGEQQLSPQRLPGAGGRFEGAQAAGVGRQGLGDAARALELASLLEVQARAAQRIGSHLAAGEAIGADRGLRAVRRAARRLPCVRRRWRAARGQPCAGHARPRALAPGSPIASIGAARASAWSAATRA